MKKRSFALQLYTVRTAAENDVAECLRRVREIGFEYVQWSGMPGCGPEEAKRLLDEAGLTAMAGHCDVAPFEEDIHAALAFWNAIGASDLAPGGMMDDCRDSLEDWKRGAKRLDAVGAKLRAQGVRWSYHNHAFEFEKFPGDERAKLDILYAETSPGHLYAELDLAWVAVGGADPAAYLRKYAGRCPVIHAKDVAAGYLDGGPVFTPLGRGSLDWQDVLLAAREAGVEWLIYEQDNAGDGDLWDAVRISYEFLKSAVQA